VLCLRNLDDPAKYKSAEFALIAVDELTRNTRETFDLLRSRLRWPGVERVRFIAGTNPGEIGHRWVKALWIDREYPPELAGQAEQFAFVKALPDDNPHLPASYWEGLETLPPGLARALRWGDWDIFEGQVFSEWRAELHVIEPQVIPSSWRRTRAIDWGYAKPMACLWLARDPDTGRVVVYRELYQAGLSDAEQAEEIRRLTRGDEHISVTYADPSMWTARAMEQQTESTADVYARHGVQLTRADNDRMTGKRRVHDALALMADGKPGLQVFSTCANLIGTLPALPYDKVRVEDVDSDAEDHAYDSLRYGLMPAPTGPRKGADRPGDYWGPVRRR
jgi:hypothetical protein